jgi:hypothetical protein
MPARDDSELHEWRSQMGSSLHAFLANLKKIIMDVKSARNEWRRFFVIFTMTSEQAALEEMSAPRHREPALIEVSSSISYKLPAPDDFSALQMLLASGIISKVQEWEI